MNLFNDLENINNFIKYLSLISKSVSEKIDDNGQAKITLQDYNIIKNLSKIITDYFSNENDNDSDADLSDMSDMSDLETLEDKHIKPLKPLKPLKPIKPINPDISDSFILKIKNNELSKEHLLSHNPNLDKKYIIFNLNCLNN